MWKIASYAATYKHVSADVSPRQCRSACLVAWGFLRAPRSEEAHPKPVPELCKVTTDGKGRGRSLGFRQPAGPVAAHGPGHGLSDGSLPQSSLCTRLIATSQGAAGLPRPARTGRVAPRGLREIPAGSSSAARKLGRDRRGAAALPAGDLRPWPRMGEGRGCS